MGWRVEGQGTGWRVCSGLAEPRQARDNGSLRPTGCDAEGQAAPPQQRAADAALAAIKIPSCAQTAPLLSTPPTPPPQETELLAAGFPCIDVSRAGLRRGLDGPVSGPPACICLVPPPAAALPLRLRLSRQPRLWPGVPSEGGCPAPRPTRGLTRARFPKQGSIKPPGLPAGPEPKLNQSPNPLKPYNPPSPRAWCATCSACWRGPPQTTAPCPGCCWRTWAFVCFCKGEL